MVPKDCDDELILKIDQALQSTRKNKEWGHDFMTLELKLNETREEALEEGREEGRMEERENSIKKMISVLQKFGYDRNKVKETLKSEYQISDAEAELYLNQF